MRTPRCKKCNAPFIFYDGRYVEDEYCRLGHPPRGSAIKHCAIPEWMRIKLGEAYPSEIRPWMRELGAKRKVPSRDIAEMFLLNSIVTPSCLIGFVDHFGADPDGNFVCEPYARDCEGCRKDAAEFARRIGAGYVITDLSFHAPWIEKCIRMTFSLRGSRFAAVKP